MRLAVFFIPFVFGFSALAEQHAEFQPGKSVYVVGISTEARDLSITSGNLEVERIAKSQFKKEKRFKLAKTLSAADFVFIIAIDTASSNDDEIALAVSAERYRKSGRSLDQLRENALWQDDSHSKNLAGHAALAGATIGLSMIFDRPSVSKGLVKEFHRSLK